jgi:hypothetical protein
VVAIQILTTRVYYLFHPETARKVLVEHQADFVKEERLLKVFNATQGDNVITTEGPAWERHRRIIAPTFGPRKVLLYMRLMAAAIEEGIGSDLPLRPVTGGTHRSAGACRRYGAQAEGGIARPIHSLSLTAGGAAACGRPPSVRGLFRPVRSLPRGHPAAVSQAATPRPVPVHFLPATAIGQETAVIRLCSRVMASRAERIAPSCHPVSSEM